MSNIVAWRITGDTGASDWVNGVPDDWTVAAVRDRGMLIQYAYDGEAGAKIPTNRLQLMIDSLNSALIEMKIISQPTDGPHLLMALQDLTDMYKQTVASVHGDDGWIANATYLLDMCPHAIRSREGAGPENLMSSLCLTFQAMQHKLKG